ncbi:MAG: helix-turn-helix domain-containing protein [Flavobacterium sp.]
MNLFISKFLTEKLPNAFTLVFLLCGALLCRAQEMTADETLKTRQIQELLLTAPEKAYAEAKTLAQSSNQFAGHCGEYYVASYFYTQSDYQKAKELLLALLKSIAEDPALSSRNNYKDLMGMCVNKLFYLYKNQGEYNSALALLASYQDKIPGDRYQQQLGILKVAMGDYKSGIELLKSDLRTSRHVKLGVAEKKEMNDKLFADRHNEIGEAYQRFYLQTEQTRYIDSADVYFNKAANLMLRDNFQKDYTQALLCMHKAKSAALKNDYASALRFYKMRELYPGPLKNRRTAQIFDLGMADCYYHLQQTDSAIFFAKEFIKNYKVTKVSKENLLMVYSLLSQCYSQKKNTEEAYNYAKMSLELINDMDKVRNKSLDFLHDYDISSIKKESDALLARRDTFRKIMFGLGLLLAAVILSFYAYYKKQRERQKEKHKRFLAIIQRLKEVRQKNVVVPETVVEGPGAKIMDEELVLKIQTGLAKLERKEAYLKSDFKLAYVAKKLNTNTAYLSQYFNQVLQKSFSEYTQEQRINFVLQKLSDSPQFRNFTLQAIAEEVGYKDASTFVKVFKKQTGLSPNYYIENLQMKDL